MSAQLFPSGSESGARAVEPQDVVIHVCVIATGYEAGREDFPLLRETGRTAWEAINRLVGAHRALLERRWSREGAA